MRIFLSQLNAVPGVVGSLVCDPKGDVLAQDFPSLFDADMLSQVSALVAKSSGGLAPATGSLRLLDFRFADARVVVRPLHGGYLLFLCASGADLQPLALSTSVAVPQIERRLASRRTASAPAAESPPAAVDPQAPAWSTPALPGPDALTPTPALASLGPSPSEVPELFALVQRIEAVIEQQRLDRFRVRGEIALKAGFGLGFIDARTPDDPAKAAKLRAAASAILGEAV